MNNIATMPAGPEMDAAVAEMLGWHANTHLSRYSGDAVAALEQWADAEPGCRQWSMGRKSDPGGYYYHILLFRRSKETAGFMQRCSIGEAPTLALAICRALLLAGREVRYAART